MQPVPLPPAEPGALCCARRRRLSEQLAHTPTAFRRDPEDPSAVALKEPWQEKVRWGWQGHGWAGLGTPSLTVASTLCPAHPPGWVEDISWGMWQRWEEIQSRFAAPE